MSALSGLVRADVPHDGSADLSVWPVSLVEHELAVQWWASPWADGSWVSLLKVCGSEVRLRAVVRSVFREREAAALLERAGL